MQRTRGVSGGLENVENQKIGTVERSSCPDRGFERSKVVSHHHWVHIRPHCYSHALNVAQQCLVITAAGEGHARKSGAGVEQRFAILHTLQLKATG